MTSLRLGVACIGIIAAVASPATAQKRALVLPVDLAGYFPSRANWKREYSLALEERLRGTRFAVVKGDVTPTQAECREPACMQTIAVAHGVDVVVTARVANDEQKLPGYHAFVRIVDRSAAGPPATRERERSCTNCTEVAARDLLATALSAALSDEPEPLPAPPVATQTEPNTPPARPEMSPVGPLPSRDDRASIVTPIRYEERFSPHQRLVFRATGIASVAVGLAFIAQGFVELHNNNDPADRNGDTRCAPNCNYHLNTASGQAVFFSLGIGGVAAGAVLSALGWKRWPARRVTLAPRVSPTATTLMLTGSF